MLHGKARARGRARRTIRGGVHATPAAEQQQLHRGALWLARQAAAIRGRCLRAGLLAEGTTGLWGTGPWGRARWSAHVLGGKKARQQLRPTSLHSHACSNCWGQATPSSLNSLVYPSPHGGGSSSSSFLSSRRNRCWRYPLPGRVLVRRQAGGRAAQPAAAGRRGAPSGGWPPPGLRRFNARRAPAASNA